MRLSICLLFLLAPLVQAQNTVMLAGGGSEGDIGDTDSWSYSLYAALVENGDVDGDGTVRVVVVSRLSETNFIPNYFEWIGETLGVAVDAFNVRVGSLTDANNPAIVGPVAMADAVFIKGGDQGKYYDLWNDTLLETHLLAVGASGGALGGTSAGAMSLAEHCLCGGRDLISADVMEDAHTIYLTDASEPGTSGIHSDFLGTLPGVFVDTHHTYRGRLGRLIGVLAKATDDLGDDSILAIGIEESSGLIIRNDTALVVGEGAVSFVTQTPQTMRYRDAGQPLVYTDLHLNRLTEGWRYVLTTRAPVTNPLPPDAEPVTYAGDGAPGDGLDLTVLGNTLADRNKFEWVATYNPQNYSLLATTAQSFLRTAVGFTDVDLNDGYRGDRQEILFRALYDRPDLSAFFVFGYYGGGGKLELIESAPDVVAFEGAMGSIVVDGMPITFRGLAPDVNYYEVRSAALVNARLHVLAESSLRGLTYNSRTHTLLGGTSGGLTIGLSILSGDPIPVGGGTLRYQVAIANSTASTQSTQYWIDQIRPTGQVRTKGPFSVTIDAGDTFTRDFAYRLRGNAPAGTYTLTGNVGTHPSTVLDSDSIPFEKLDSDPAAAALAGDLSEGFALSAVFPNPFNETAEFTLEVAESQHVTVAVYNALGRREAMLHDGVLEAGGLHRFIVTGQDLPSGVYVIRVTGDAFTEMRRVTVVR